MTLDRISCKQQYTKMLYSKERGHNQITLWQESKIVTMIVSLKVVWELGIIRVLNLYLDPLSSSRERSRVVRIAVPLLLRAGIGLIAQ